MNNITLDGVLMEMPKVQYCKKCKNRIVALFTIRNGKDEHDCFVLGEAALKLSKIQKGDDVRISGSLQNYRYYDMYHTLHRTKYVLVYDIWAENMTFECNAEEKRKIDLWNSEYLDAGYQPLQIVKQCV